MIQITKCCGVWDLKTGTLIVGISGILFTIGSIIVHTTALDEMDEDLKEHVKIVILFSYIRVFLDAMLIYGTIKEQKNFLLPWIGCTGFALILFSVFCIIFMFFIPGVVLGTFFAVGFWYAWYCVVCYYNELKAPTSTLVTVNNYPGTEQTSFMAPTVVSYEETKPPTYSEVVEKPNMV